MNKINFKVLISILLVAFSFIACGGDDKNEDEVTKTNHFLYEGKEYPLSRAAFLFDGPFGPNGSFLISLDLYSSGIKSDPIDQTLSGKGDLMTFAFFSLVENELSSGTYTFNSTQEAFTFIIGEAIINVDIDAGGNFTRLLATEGTVKVNKTGEIYEFDIDFTLSDGKKVTGYYKGEVK